MNWNALTRSRAGCPVLTQKVAQGRAGVGLIPVEVTHAPATLETAVTATVSNGTPNAKRFIVPQGVSFLDLAVAGASGGVGTTSLFVNNGGGGLGAVITGTLPVTPGDTVTFYGSYSGGPAGNNGAGGTAGPGYLAGGTGGSKLSINSNPDRAGGGGGGASAVLVNGLPVIIAGGGGGGGGRGTLPGSAGGDGGNGTCPGDAGQFSGGSGGNGGHSNFGNECAGSQCDTPSGGGAGGGGGGGYSSGAGGQCVASKGGGGGGGGGNFCASNLVNLVIETNPVANGSVRITYRVNPVATAHIDASDVL